MKNSFLNNSRKSSHYLSDPRGAIAVIFALTLTPFIIVMGMAIELTRASDIDTELAYACDAGAIAGARYQLADVTTNATNFFNANFSQDKSGLSITPVVTLSSDNTSVSVSANGAMPTYFGVIPGISQINVSSASTVLRTFQNAEVALVLDNTGSMADNGKIQGLRNAATNLINIVFQNKPTSNTVAVSIVPYVAAVNIGTKNTSWLADPQTLNSFPASASWAGCVGVVDTGTTMDNDNPPSASRKWPVYLAASTYKLFGTQPGDNDWSVVNGAVKINTPISGVTVGPNRSCGLPIQPLTNDRNTLLNEVSQMTPINGGGTFGNLGLVWGWNTISPKWTGLWGAIDPKSYSQVQKYVVIVTDGQNEWYAQPGYVPNGDPTAYGFSQPKNGNLSQGLLGTTNINNARSYIDNRLLKLCSQMNTAGIQIFTVTFQVSDSLAKQIYQQCASKPEYAFQAETAQDIYNIFANIGSITQSIIVVK